MFLAYNLFYQLRILVFSLDPSARILIPSRSSLSKHFTIQDTTSCLDINERNDFAITSSTNHPTPTPGGPGIDKSYLLRPPCRKLIVMVKMSLINSS